LTERVGKEGGKKCWSFREGATLLGKGEGGELSSYSNRKWMLPSLRAKGKVKDPERKKAPPPFLLGKEDPTAVSCPGRGGGRGDTTPPGAKGKKRREPSCPEGLFFFLPDG